MIWNVCLLTWVQAQPDIKSAEDRDCEKHDSVICDSRVVHGIRVFPVHQIFTWVFRCLIHLRTSHGLHDPTCVRKGGLIPPGFLGTRAYVSPIKNMKKTSGDHLKKFGTEEDVHFRGLESRTIILRCPFNKNSCGVTWTVTRSSVCNWLFLPLLSLDYDFLKQSLLVDRDQLVVVPHFPMDCSQCSPQWL